MVDHAREVQHEFMPTGDFDPVTNKTLSPQVAEEDVPPQRLEIHIPWVTFIKVFAAVLIAYAAYVLWPLLLLIFLALFLAVTLHAFVAWFDARGVRHWLSLLMVIGCLLIMLAAGIALIFPALIDRAAVFSEKLPTLYE